MNMSLSEELKTTFDLATLRHEATKQLNSAEWKEYQQIKRRYDNQRKYEQRQFEMEYKTRFEIARKRLINKAGSKSKDFKHRWFGHDQFDKSAINRQAQRSVMAQHHALISHIDKMEATDIRRLLENCEHRHQQREKPKQDFSRAADRRQIPDRRQRLRQRTR